MLTVRSEIGPYRHPSQTSDTPKAQWPRVERSGTLGLECLILLKTPARRQFCRGVACNALCSLDICRGVTALQLDNMALQAAAV